MEKLISLDESREKLLDEWMQENPPFDNDAVTFEEFLINRIRKLEKELHESRPN